MTFHRSSTFAALSLFLCLSLWSSTEGKSKNQSLLHVKYLQSVPYTIKFKTL